MVLFIQYASDRATKRFSYAVTVKLAPADELLLETALALRPYCCRFWTIVE
jgi:hypothetical protein